MKEIVRILGEYINSHSNPLMDKIYYFLAAICYR